MLENRICEDRKKDNTHHSHVKFIPGTQICLTFKNQSTPRYVFRIIEDLGSQKCSL